MAYAKSYAILSVLGLALLVSGCTISFEGTGGGQARTDGGVFKSDTSGATWRQTVAIATVGGRPASFNGENIISLVIDPQDNQAVYAGTTGNGMVYSYDAAASWSVARSLGKRPVRDIAISPLDTCTIFVASENKVFRSTDCARNWSEMYFDNDRSIAILTLAFHPANGQVIFAGTSRGEVIVSRDAGASWSVLQRFSDARRRDDNAVIKIIVSEKNTNLLWAATSGSGVYRSEDGGRSWRGFVEELIEVHTRDANQVNDLAFSQADGRTVIIATAAGLIRSSDNGGRWQLMELIPPADKIAINNVEIFAGDPRYIYYATNTSFGWTEDGGATWSSKKLPSTRRGTALAVDPDNALVVYLGVRAVEN